MDISEDNIGVIIDNGSCKCKAGFVGDDAPRAVFPKFVGQTKGDNSVAFLSQKEAIVGDEAQNRRQALSVIHPVQRGVIVNWDAMESVWDHVFRKELRVRPQDYPVLLTEKPFTPNSNREKSAEIMFETFEVPSFFLVMDAAMSLIASGRTTGVILDSGQGVSHVVPMHEGHVQYHAIERVNMAGSDLTNFLAKSLNEQGASFKSQTDLETVTRIKETMCFTALNFSHGIYKSASFSDPDKPYKLPDGRVITIGNERFRCPEAMFRPYLMGLETPGIHEAVFNSITKCDLDIRNDLYLNVILSGSSTMFPGFQDRIKIEIDNFLSTRNRSMVRVSAPPERKLSVWIGASILASLSTFKKLWITRQEYNEYGQNILRTKCPADQSYLSKLLNDNESGS